LRWGRASIIIAVARENTPEETPLWIPARATLNSLLTCATQAATGAVAGPLNAAFLGLYIAPTPNLTPDSPLSAITEASFVGYVRQAVVWGSPYRAADGNECVDAHSLQFRPGDNTKPETITGLLLANAATGGALIASLPLPSPGIPLADQNALLDVMIRWAQDAAADYGDYALLN
jgi:hypothetical protein